MSLALVGVGSMGEALLSGWIASGWEPADIIMVQRSDARATEIQQRHGVARGSLEDAAGADVVVLGVKPYQILQVAADLAPHLGPATLVVSVAAGITLAQLASVLPAGQPVARVMPNTPSLLREGMAGVAMGENASDADREQVISLFNAVGKAVVVDEESIHALIGVSGSAPAFLFHIADALIEAGVQQGLKRSDATVLVNQTFTGAAAMLQGSGESASVLRERVTSPGGTTAAGLREMEERGLRAGIMATVEATVRRSREMSSGSEDTHG